MSDKWTIQYVGSSDVRTISEDDIRTKLNVPYGEDLVLPRFEIVEITPLLADKLTGWPELIVRPPAEPGEPEVPDTESAKKASGTTRKKATEQA